MKQNILKELYSSKINGYKDIIKTLKQIQQYYSWIGMKQDVKNYIKACQKQKLIREKTKVPTLITDTPSKTFQKVPIDIVGPLPETKNGNKYILVGIRGEFWSSAGRGGVLRARSMTSCGEGVPAGEGYAGREREQMFGPISRGTLCRKNRNKDLPLLHLYNAMQHVIL